MGAVARLGRKRRGGVEVKGGAWSVCWIVDLGFLKLFPFGGSKINMSGRLL